MQQSFKCFALTVLVFLTGCQTLPGPLSDLRPPARDTSSPEGTPLSEILSRSNGPSESQAEIEDDSLPRINDSSPGEPAALLSIGIEPAPQSPITNENVTEAQKVTSDGVADQAETSLGTAMPEVVDLNASGESAPSFQNQSVLKLSISEQLDWLPSLDDTLAAMTGRVANTDQLDGKIEALMSLAYVVDAQLYIAFRDLLDRLDSMEAELLLAEQREWLTQRKDNLTRAYLEFKADKAGRYNAAQAFLRDSHQRMREIQARLNELNPS